MRDRMERLVILPFSVGCISEASVAVGVQPPRRSRLDITASSPTKSKEEEDSYDQSLSGEENTKNSLRFLQVVPKSNISTGFHRLFKGFKNFSQLFADKEELDELETEMEIGCPTDVQHVTHIGCDGSASANPIMGWDNLITPELLSISSISEKRFELSPAENVTEMPLVQGCSL